MLIDIRLLHPTQLKFENRQFLATFVTTAPQSSTLYIDPITLPFARDTPSISSGSIPPLFGISLPVSDTSPVDVVRPPIILPDLLKKSRF